MKHGDFPGTNQQIFWCRHKLRYYSDWMWLMQFCLNSSHCARLCLELFTFKLTKVLRNVHHHSSMALQLLMASRREPSLPKSLKRKNAGIPQVSLGLRFTINVSLWVPWYSRKDAMRTVDLSIFVWEARWDCLKIGVPKKSMVDHNVPPLRFLKRPYNIIQLPFWMYTLHTV